MNFIKEINELMNIRNNLYDFCKDNIKNMSKDNLTYLLFQLNRIDNVINKMSSKLNIKETDDQMKIIMNM